MKLSENVVVSNLEEENQFLIKLISSLDMHISLEYSHVPFSNKKKSKKRITVLLMERKGKLYSANLVVPNGASTIYFRLLDNSNKIIVLDNKQEFNFELDESKLDNETFSDEELEEAISTAQESDNVVHVMPTMALIPMNERGLVYPRRGLRFSYKLNKRIRLIILKLFKRLPNFITGNYRRRINL